LNRRRLRRPALIVALLILVTILIYLLSPHAFAPVKGPTRTPHAAETEERRPTQSPPVLSETPGTPTPIATPLPTDTETPTDTKAPTMTRTPTLTPSPTIVGPDGMHVILNETFDGTQLNAELWNTQFHWGNTNPPELEQYIPDALQVHSGTLSITANKNSKGGMPYTSGVITSFDRFYFQYGYVEIRAKLPKGRGLWPALWLLAQNQSADEIDIMELLGDDPKTIYTTLHYRQGNQPTSKLDARIQGQDFSEGYHTYAVDWEWDRIVWYIDGREVFRVNDHIPHTPMYVIADLAVGGEWAGPPDSSTNFPATFNINYIRVFTH
jgi:hypothetical protein